MYKIRRGDTVILISGKDKNKQGTVLDFKKNDRVLVSGLNMVKRHTKADPNKGEKGGLVAKEMSMHISNVAIFNSSTGRADRVGFKFLEDNKKVRIFKSSRELLQGRD